MIIQSTLCVSCAPFIFELSLNVTINHSEVQTVVQTILSLFSGLILLVNWGTFNFQLIKFIKTTENTISA